MNIKQYQYYIQREKYNKKMTAIYLLFILSLLFLSRLK